MLLFAACNTFFWPRVRSLTPRSRLLRRSGLRAMAARAALTPGSICALIPARNEEANLPRLLESLLLQGPELSSIVVLDDESTDGTSEVVRRYMQRDSRIRLLSGLPLPAGWSGKSWACTQMAQTAREPWLLFLDADTCLARGAAAGILAAALRRGLSFLSCWPRFEAGSFAEGVFMPMLNFITFTIFPVALGAKRATTPQLSIASGACIIVERSIYERLGGHSAIHTGILEDHKIARYWREQGERGSCLDGNKVVSVRMYRSLGEAWNGFTKNFTAAFRSPLLFWMFIAVHPVLLGSVPLLALIGLFAGWPVLPLLIASGCLLGVRLLLALRLREPLWPILLHPVGLAGTALCALNSFVSVASGRGVEWKGRRYLGSAEKAPETAAAQAYVEAA